MDDGQHGTGARPLRALTYLAPGIPVEFFEAVCAHLARVLSHGVSLEVEDRISGPMHGQFDPFAEDRADIGFLCSPSYLYLRAQARPSVELVPAAFVFDDARAAGRPVYYSEVVVRADHPARAFSELAGSTWGYNDECSLSGYFATLQRLAELGHDESFFGQHQRTGSHHASIEATLAGSIDGAAIDSTVLASVRRERPELDGRLRVLDSFGPFPIQPVVLRRELVPAWGERIAGALLELGQAGAPGESGSWPASFGLRGCAPIDDGAYADERRALCALGQLPGRSG